VKPPEYQSQLHHFQYVEAENCVPRPDERAKREDFICSENALKFSGKKSS
jgi:hypothetical protein